MKPFKVTAALLASGLVAGCSGLQALWEDRYGPSPILDPVQVQLATAKQVDVLRAFALGADLPWPPSLSTQSDYWYRVTLAGFNFVDDACTRYMEDLFGWERKRNRTKDILALAASSTAAILGATGAGTQSLVIVAQAFGFATGATTIFADSYLFKLHPSTIQSIVLKLQEAYRNAAADPARKALIVNGGPSVAYQYVRGYLTLCLPVTLEQKIDEYLQATSAGQNAPPGTVPGGGAAMMALPPAATTAGTPNVSLTSK